MVARAMQYVPTTFAYGTQLFNHTRWVFTRPTDIFSNWYLHSYIDVKWLFSTGHLLLLHVQSWLSVQSTHALLCLNTWSTLGLIKDSDVQKVAELQDIEGEDEDGWDSIII